MQSNPNYYTLYFKINYHTNYGEYVAVCGNNETFGNWNYKNSFKLKWTFVD